MKSNFKKILSGLALLTLVAGCGEKTDSSSNNTNSGNTSSVVSSSIAPVDKTEVTEAEWSNALDISKVNNITYDATLAQNASMPYMSMDVTANQLMKIDNDKASLEVSATQKITIKKDAFMEEMGITSDAQFELSVEAIKTRYNATMTVSEDGNTYTLDVPTMMVASQFVEKVTEETVNVYEYDAEEEKYYKATYLGNYRKEYVDPELEMFLFGDEYDLAEYDATKKAYHFDKEDLVSLDMIDSEATAADMYYYFVNNELVKFEIVLTEDGTNYNYVYNAKDKGTTTVTMPAADNVIVCEHKGETYEGVNEEYHYTGCSECDSVLTYEKHTFDDDDCTKCGYYPSTHEKLVIAGFEVEVEYNELTGNAVNVYVTSDDSEWDSETRGVKYTNEDTTNYVMETTTSSLVENETCLYLDTTAYKFYNENGEEIASPIYVYESHYEHSYGAPVTTQNGCTVTDTSTCEDCGYVDVYEYDAHLYGDPVYGEADDECNVHYTIHCVTCNELLEEGTETRHNYEYEILVEPTDEAPGQATITCTECGDSRNVNYQVYNYGDNHSLFFFTPDWSFMEELAENHSYDSEGNCICGATETAE